MHVLRDCAGDAAHVANRTGSPAVYSTHKPISSLWIVVVRGKNKNLLDSYYDHKSRLVTIFKAKKSTILLLQYITHHNNHDEQFDNHDERVPAHSTTLRTQQELLCSSRKFRRVATTTTATTGEDGLLLSDRIISQR